MSKVSVHSALSAEHPRKAAVEAVFEEVLGADRHSWTVVLQPVHGIFWTVYVIRDTDDFRRVLLLDEPRQQTPAAIARELRLVLRAARVQDTNESRLRRSHPIGAGTE